MGFFADLVISLCEKPTLDSQDLRAMMEELLGKISSVANKTKKGKSRAPR
jgi:hypothetical protein